jgi:hypothetical protein
MMQKRLSFALGLLADSIMRFYRFWYGKSRKSIQDGHQILIYF